MRNFQEVFLIMLSSFADLKLMNVLFIHETFLVYKLETFTNCKEVNHVMIMRSLINSWKLLSENPQLLPTFLKKSLPIFTHFPTKNSKSASTPSPTFCQHWKFFGPLLQKEGVGGGGHYAFFSKNGLILHNFDLMK